MTRLLHNKIKVYTWNTFAYILLVLPLAVFANGETGCVEGTLCNPIKAKTLAEFLQAVVTVARDLGLLVAVLGIVYAGFLKVSARGDEEKLKKSDAVFLWTLVGTAVLLGAWVIAFAIQGTITELETRTGI